jgi:hypothetical protein
MASRSLLIRDQTAVWHLDAARGPSTPSFDDFVGTQEEGFGDAEADRLGGYWEA